MILMLDWLACTLVKLISALFCCLPAGVAVWIGQWLGQAAMWLQPKRTRIGLQNLRAAFDLPAPARFASQSEAAGAQAGSALSPSEARRIIRDCYRQLGASFIELLRLPVIDRAYIERYVTMEGRANFEGAVTSGRPVILLTGHYGNWELSSITAALIGYPIMALARAQEKFPRLYRLLVSFRESKGCRIIHKGGAMKRLIAALDGKQLVGIVGDQASRQGIFVDFFGRPALFATGPFELARSKEALILPAFIHRVRGPYHRVVVEPPMTISRTGPKAAAVRAGVEQFAGRLVRHIRESPPQWLWMHKRWKRTPARRVLVLSDGKAGHLKQSLAVVDALRERHPGLTHAVVEVRYRSPSARLVAFLWSWASAGGLGAIPCLAWALSPESAQALLGRYADLIVSCGSSLAPVTLLWAAENRAKSAVIMNPAPLPLRRFTLVIAPRHDALPARPNVVNVLGALASPPREDPQRAVARLRAHPRFQPAPPGDAEPVGPASPDGFGSPRPPHRHPVTAVFIGGDTPHHEISTSFTDGLITQVQAACEAADGWCLVTTSRRTSAAVERRLMEQLGHDVRCRLLLLAGRDALNLPAPVRFASQSEAAGAQAGGTMEGMLGSADVAVVTGESISMVSEACASGCRVLIVEPPLRPDRRGRLGKHARFLQEMEQGGYITRVEAADVSSAIERALSDRTTPKRLDNLAAVREALEKLL